MRKYIQGKFNPINPKKYRGNANNIIYRSSYELKLMSELDTNPNVLEWASEEFHIEYISPVDKRKHRYFPDFWIKAKRPDGKIMVTVAEIKPNVQTKIPKNTPRKRQKTLINEVETYAINRAKWQTAEAFCKDRGWLFEVWDEFDLNIRQKK